MTCFDVLSCFDECFRAAGMKINLDKTEILIINRGPKETLNIEVRGTRVKETETVKYLGCTFTDTGDKNKQEITERIVKYNKCAYALYPLMNDAYMPKDVRKAIFEGVLTPIITYGSESWTLTTKDKSRIQASEMKPLRTIVKKTRRDHIRNEDIRRMVGVIPMLNKIEKRQLQWLGHVERMDEERIAKKRWNWTPEGRRSRGRPRKRWKDAVAEILLKYDIPTIEDLRRRGIFEDRREWKRQLIPLTG